MVQCGLIITIIKPQNFKTEQTTYTCDSLDDAKNKLIERLVSVFSINIDYPFDFVDFEYQWFEQQYINSNAFYYKIFIEGKWESPWEEQEIYSDVLDRIQSIEEANPPNFDEIYGEPDPDEDIINKFSMEQNEIDEFEKKICKIIKQSKEVDSDNQVKECNCLRCKEAHP